MRKYLPFLTGLLACLFGFCLNVTGTDLGFFPGDLGDARFNTYILEHNFRFVAGDAPSYWSAPFMYPEKSTLTYSDNLMGSAPFYIVYRLLGYTREISFILWFITVSLANYAACYFFLDYLSGNRRAAVIGALVFACSIALQSQLTHAQTFIRFPIPLAFWMAIRFARGWEPRHLFFCGIATAYQFYCAFYLGFLLLAPLGIFLFLCVLFNWPILRPHLASRTWWKKIALAVTVCVACLSPLVVPYLFRAGEMGFHHYQAVVESVPEPASRFYSKPSSLFWDFLSHVNDGHPTYWDDQIFPGGVAWAGLLGCLVIAIVRRKREPDRTVLLLMLTAVFTMLLFTRFGRFSFYNIAYNVLPGYASMRSLQRIVNVELIFFAAGAACVASFVLRTRAQKAILFPALLALVVADNAARQPTIYRFPRAGAESRVDALTKKIRAGGDPPLISYEPDSIHGMAEYYHIDAMLAAQEAGVATLNAYTATSPQVFTPYWRRPDSAGRMKWLNFHRLDPGRVTVIH